MTAVFYAERPPVDADAETWRWQDEAACRGEDLELFFGSDGETRDDREEREDIARAVCSECPVLGACADYALTRPERDGVWGGMTPDDRAVERRRRRGPARSTCRRGHDMSTARWTSRGAWTCRVCERDAARRRREAA